MSESRIDHQSLKRSPVILMPSQAKQSMTAQQKTGVYLLSKVLIVHSECFSNLWKAYPDD